MRKFVYIFILGLLFTGCNFPLMQTQVPAAAVATQVAFYLTQTAESIPPSETPSLNQFTPSQQPSQTITPTITPPVDDPATSLGNPIWTNGLSSGNPFGLTTPFDDGNTKIYLQNGKMVLISQQASGYKGWRVSPHQITSYYLEAIFTTQTCTSLDQYGLVFRAPDYSSGMGYYYSVSCDGRFGLMRWNTDNTQSFILNWVTDSNINPGSNQTNRLGVYVKASSIRLYMNGKQIAETTDSTYLTATNVGAYISTVSTPGFTVEMSQIQLWNVP